MCVAELNVSLLDCRHRWYHLARPCSPGVNLATCGKRLALAGWEIKCDFCPYCSDWGVGISDYRLVGNDRSPSVGGLNRNPSVALSSERYDSRRGSLARTDSSTSVTMMSAQEKNRALNARVDAYLRVAPGDLSERAGEDEADGVGGFPSPSPSDSDKSEKSQDTESLTESATKSRSVFGKSWKKSKRFSKTLFKAGSY